MADQVEKFVEDSGARAEFLKAFFERNAADGKLSDQADAIGTILMEICEELGVDIVSYDDVITLKKDDGMKADSMTFDEFDGKYGEYIFKSIKLKNGL